ncbi:hypothetical protein PHET_10702 [Paragonimus heterotremus]|uniref:Reverse transcriptase domain-containing protein n=1 Tax=Paragonimus heterotremus TaxID=100268 RepID=A0A8J4T9P7_9TREM|nr:hypothetical protein PHET_10702 [Paragonimus heterotremus]
MQGSAFGPDRHMPTDLCKYHPATLSALFNSFLLSANLIKALNVARITFIPETDIPATTSDFRPISTTSVVTRRFHKILFDRWCQSFPSDRQQIGFLRRDGCFEMFSILHFSNRYCHSACKSLSFANIDISKAFNHISYDTSPGGLILRGPSVLLSYFRNVYSTDVCFFDHFTFSPQQGVHQWDPLSLLLFIMSLGEALANSHNQLLTFRTPGGGLDYLAYANDVLLFTGFREALSVRLERLQAELRDVGLSIAWRKHSVHTS